MFVLTHLEKKKTLQTQVRTKEYGKTNGIFDDNALHGFSFCSSAIASQKA